MNYDKVNNPFDMYDEREDFDEFEDKYENLDFSEGVEENELDVQKNSRLMSVIMIVSYVLILVLAFLGIVGLCNGQTRDTILHSVFFFI